MKGCLILICVLGSLVHAGFGAKDSAKKPSKLKKRWEHRLVTFNENNHNEEFWTFVTRPDLDAPRWKIQVYDEEKVTDGYWFVAPYEEVEQENGSAAWNAPHIYDRHGELVWSGAALFEGFSTFDFRVSEVLGQPMLSLIRPHSNHAVILNETYGIFKEIYIGNHNPSLNEMGLNMHEFMTIESGTKGKHISTTTYIFTPSNPRPSSSVPYMRSQVCVEEPFCRHRLRRRMPRCVRRVRGDGHQRVRAQVHLERLRTYRP
jgi:hypothetical protein